VIRTTGSGRSAASLSTSPPPSSCAGSPVIAALGWPVSATSPTWLISGSRSPTRSMQTSVSTGWTRGVFVQRYGASALDASLLLMPLVGFLPPYDPRIRATVLAIADELTENGLVLRYRVDEVDEELSGEEGTFAIASFWLVSALVQIGEAERARTLCERLLSLASPLGLYAEELDPVTGRHLGNFPQAFTHLALIDSVLRVIRDGEQAAYSGQPCQRPRGRHTDDRASHTHLTIVGKPIT
jgi:Glycosyl hydrolases family 15